MSLWLARWLAAGCCWAAGVTLAADAACGEALGQGVRRVQAGPVTLAWLPRPQPLPLDRAFQVELQVCGATPAAVAVDADMPAHRHGMNYRSRVQAAGEGRYLATGLLFHMPGRWRLIFDVDVDGQRLRLTDTVELK
jgi:hypothetical protein